MKLFPNLSNSREQLFSKATNLIPSKTSKLIAAIATATKLVLSPAQGKAQDFNYYGDGQNENIAQMSHNTEEHGNEHNEHDEHEEHGSHAHKFVTGEIAFLAGFHYHLNGEESAEPMLSTHLGLGIGKTHQFLIGIGGGLIFHNEGEYLVVHGCEANIYTGFALALGERVHIPFTVGLGAEIDENGEATFQLPLHTGIGIHLTKLVGLEFEGGVGLPIPTSRDLRRGYDLSKSDAHFGVGVSFSF